MRIIALSPPIPQLVNIAHKHPSVETLMFENDNKFTGSTPGVFLPNKQAIVIDPKKCIEKSLSWAGMYTLPATWFVMLWTLYHEIHHAENMAEYEVDPQKGELKANEYAYKKVHAYDRPLPSIKDMGWAGHTLSTILSVQSKVHHQQWAKLQILAYQNNMVANLNDLRKVGVTTYTKEIEGHFFLSAKDYFNLDVEKKEEK